MVIVTATGVFYCPFMHTTFVYIINVAARVALIGAGIAILSGMNVFARFDQDMNNLFGGALVILGVYRLIIYHVRLKNAENNDDEE